MTKTFKYYGVIWTICFLVFNIVIFVSPVSKSAISGNFWTGYIFIVLAFIGQFICSYIALNEKNKKKMFYNVSLALINYISFAVMLIIGILCMIFPVLPVSIGVIVCVFVAGIYAILVVTTCFVVDVVSTIDKEIENKTFLIKTLTANAEHLMVIANSSEMKGICKKVYENFKYSDVMSDSKLVEINEQIEKQFKSFENAVNNNDIELANSIAQELNSLIDARNKKCKLLKK